MESPPFPRLLVDASLQPEVNGEASLFFAGDFYVRPGHVFHTPGDLFSPAIGNIIERSTFSLANFEGALPAGNTPRIRKEGPHLAFDNRALDILKQSGFNAITLANNHAMDYGEAALGYALQVGAACGLQHVGAGLNLRQAIAPLSLSLAGNLRLRIFSFCEREFGVSAGNSAGTAWLTSPQAENAVRQARQESDLVIVCAHGGNELMPLPSPQRRQQLRSLMDAGADLVIGHHPHVPQAWEQYGHGYIFYSLGDFYFDSTDGRRYEYRDWGFALRIWLQERRIEAVQIVPYERVRDQLVPLGSQRNAERHISYLQQLARILAAPDFEGYWQHLAVERLGAYVPYLSARGTSFPRIPFRDRIAETLRIGHDLCGLWLGRPQPAPSSSSGAKALGTLNVVRCESHRWAIESALAVLGGECQDLRSARIKNELESMRPFYGRIDTY